MDRGHRAEAVDDKRAEKPQDKKSKLRGRSQSKRACGVDSPMEVKKPRPLPVRKIRAVCLLPGREGVGGGGGTVSHQPDKRTVAHFGLPEDSLAAK